MKLCGLIPNSYIHVSVSHLCIPRMSLPISLQQNRQTDSWNIYRSQIHKCGNWGTEHYNSVLEIKRLSFISEEYINRNQTFIFNSHRPFICSADWGSADEIYRRTMNTNLCPTMQ
jgi:hypothetical protein